MQRQICIICAAIAMAGPVAAESGKFSVFGPSAEREAFFEAQRQERLDREEALRKDQIERLRIASEERAAIAQAQAEASRPRATVGSWCLPPKDLAYGPTEIVGGGLTVQSVDLLSCRTASWPRQRRFETRSRLSLSFGEDGFSGTGRFNTPGLSVNLNVD